MKQTATAAVLTREQITEMQAALVRCRTEAAAAMYRTDAYERPYRAGRGEMYRLWNLMGQALEVLDAFAREHVADAESSGTGGVPALTVDQTATKDFRAAGNDSTR